MNNLEDAGKAMHKLASDIAGLYRSITGDGVRETLRALKRYIPISIYEVSSGTKVFDWVVPPEWNISDAYVTDSIGKKIIDFKKNHLHVVGYSMPVDTQVGFEKLQEHLHSLPAQPDAIPYVTSYYKEHWGFCIAEKERRKLKPDTYHVRIDSSFKKGFLTYADLIIPGTEKKEVLLSTYVCHPAMGNDNLSGIVVTTYLAKWLLKQKRRFTYRIVFIPETIGSLTYLSKHLKTMRARTIAGFNITCVGDDHSYSFMPSRQGDALSDRIALHVLSHCHPEFKRYSYLARGGDERQYCAPGADLPVTSVMRSKYNTFPEYHTSLDDLHFITPAGLLGGLNVLKDCIEVIENNHTYIATMIGEPQLGRRGLFPTLSVKGSPSTADLHLNNLLGYADGTKDLVAIADAIGASVFDLIPMTQTLLRAKLLRILRAR